MRTIKGVWIGIISFVILFFLIGMILSDTQIVSRDLWIKTEQSKLDSLFHNPNNWSKWHAQLIDNPNVELKSLGYKETAQLHVLVSKGASSLLKTDSIGDGYFSFVTTIDNEDNGIKTYSWFDYKEEEGTIVLKFTNRYYLGNNPFYRFVGLGFDRIMGNETNAMLENISELLESGNY